MTSTIDRDGRTITNAYDADDRLTTQVWLNSSGTATNTLTYAYDADSDLTVAANNAGAYTMSYDKLGDLTAEQEPFGTALTMAYDAVGNRTQVADSFGGVTTSADDRLTEREFSNGTTPLSFDMSYTSRSQLASVTRYNSLTQNGGTEVGSSAYTYNAEGLLTNLQHNSGTSSGGNLFNTTYTYDLNDRLTSISQAGSSPVTYTYNALNELTGDTSSATPTYSYDANGNRTNPGDTVGTDNQISTDGTWTYTYDKEGNVTQKTDAAGDKWQYTYDNANELVNATYTPTGTTVASTVCTYVYDVFGNKIEQEETVSGVTTITKFAYDGTNVWAAMSSSNALQTRYVYMDGSTTPVAQISSGGTVNWYDTDYEGSVRVVTNNSTGAAVDTITYDAYGNILSESNPVAGDNDKWVGGFYDGAVQLYGFGGSPYNPADGTWLHQDLLYPLSGTDPYEYCGNDPSNATDPSGLDWEWAWNWHHLLPQSLFSADALKERNITLGPGVDLHSAEYGYMLRGKDHIGTGGIHSEGWNKEWKAWLENHRGKTITKGMVDAQLNRMIGSDKFRRFFTNPTIGRKATRCYRAWSQYLKGKAARLLMKGKRVAPFLKKAIPFIALYFWAEDVKAMGPEGGTLNTLLDSTPLINWIKLLAEAEEDDGSGEDPAAAEFLGKTWLPSETPPGPPPPSPWMLRPSAGLPLDRPPGMSEAELLRRQGWQMREALDQAKQQSQPQQQPAPRPPWPPIPIPTK